MSLTERKTAAEMVEGCLEKHNVLNKGNFYPQYDSAELFRYHYKDRRKGKNKVEEK
jgi:hypothetical protein